eukprot:NODE_5828_length_549_cov_44.494000_g5085_i0.p1 GENE.NODE_5828_length_549_cov_44.494000_g5085_i0~~NODE_5828_length_549_cov_44.494000_g5085_i0.p1  ORF type:complete len:58 (+),score=14.76 NODE_5828_length_549_cov_44.494000_g5085_i0:25-174(+)
MGWFIVVKDNLPDDIHVEEDIPAVVPLSGDPQKLPVESNDTVTITWEND